MDLVHELQSKMSELTTSLKLLRENGQRLAQSEHDYKVALSIEALRLRDGGMAIGMIDKVIYGLPEIARLRMKRDVAQTMYDANQEHLNVTKLQMRIIEGQLKREWGE
jgi:hypothetical protein